MDSLLADLSVVPGYSVLMYWRILAMDTYENITASADTFTYWAVREVISSIGKQSRKELNEFALDQNYPNPFNPITKIKYSLKTEKTVSLKIYNSIGQAVRTLVNKKQTAGSKEIYWNGRDDFGREVASGIYIYQQKFDRYSSEPLVFLAYGLF